PDSAILLLGTDAEQGIKYLQTRYLLFSAFSFTYKYRTLRVRPGSAATFAAEKNSGQSVD
ncbi:hypothetical protein, partial [Alistipes finegoldii]|uniref:hypothetical protein n=1 Tax=Alistipes finegoldii TaxID=214856 RepID=UPI0026656345